MIFNTNTNYYHAMDKLSSEPLIEPLMSEDQAAVKDALNMGTAELGTTTNPMENAVQSVKSRIMQGTGRLEFSFMGKGKGNSQQPTPESFDRFERQDMKELLTINDIKSSVHASVHMESLAGLGKDGFSGAQQEEALREIKRAVDFAGDVTDGGAIVFHLSEWQRPLTYAGQRTLKNEKQWMFKGYYDEEEDAQLLLVDNRTGDFIQGIKKDKLVYEPDYKTAGSFKKDLVGKKVTITEGGQTREHIVKPEDWVTIDGSVIPRYTKDTDVLFNRVPIWNENNTNFEVKERDWAYFVKEAENWNKANPDDQKTPEEVLARIELENRVLQSKGASLYHAQRYNMYTRQEKKIIDALELYKAYEHAVGDEKERLRMKISENSYARELLQDDNLLPSELLERELKDTRDSMRHIHESSAAADAQARQYSELIKHMETAEEFGLKKTTQAISRIGLMAMEETKRKGLKEALYAAPENYDQHMYGSHPDEMRLIIEKSREEMARQLMREKKAHSMEEGLKKAKEHIKGTLDIGHLNMWRQHFDPIDDNGKSIYNTAEEREKAFEKWMIKEADKLVKDGVIGHIHLSDNFGYDDEHLTPGRGNVPMKEFLKKLEKQGMKDIIVEPGSFNPLTALPDTLSFVGSPVYGVGRLPRFNQVQHAHFGYNAPPFFIAGAYAPSNDWRPWTEVPLE